MRGVCYNFRACILYVVVGWIASGCGGSDCVSSYYMCMVPIMSLSSMAAYEYLSMCVKPKWRVLVASCLCVVTHVIVSGGMSAAGDTYCWYVGICVWVGVVRCKVACHFV